MTYAEYLKAQGATEEDLKIMDTPIGRKAFDAMQADAEARVQNYKTEADKWYNDTILPNYSAMEQKAAAAAANEARARALILASQDEGLKKVAKEMGFNSDGTPTPTPTPGAPANFDPTKFVTVDTLQGLTDRVGDGLAQLQDMVLEHGQLFPDRPLNVRAVRQEAVAARKNVYEYWEQKFNVSATRTAREDASKKAHDDAIRKEERDKVIGEYADRQANPNMVPGSTSTNVLAARPSAGRDKMPWESNLDGDNGSNDRTQRATKLFVQKQEAGRAS